MADTDGPRAPCTAPELVLKVVLAGTLAHYETRGMIDNKRLEHMLQAGKQILYKSHQESDVRQNLGFSPNIWEGLTNVLAKAIPVLESQSFSWKNPAFSVFDGSSSSDLIAANYFTLTKDIERLNDLCTIARNLLATTKKAQNLAAEKGFDQQILKMIDICVRVTARGFDGEANPKNEDKWQKIVNLYKRLLITCLQFLHNFVMHNEHRKLVLWLDLFGSSQMGETEAPAAIEPTEPSATQAAREARIKATVERLPDPGTLTAEGGLGYNIDDVHALFDLMSTEKPPDGTTQEAARQLMDKIRSDMERLSGLSASQLDENPEALLKVGAALRAQLPTKDFPLPSAITGETAKPLHKPSIDSSHTASPGPVAASPSHNRMTAWSDLPELGTYGEASTSNNEITEEDMAMPRTSQSAAETLQEAKDELMARLQETTPMIGAHVNQSYDSNGVQDELVDDDLRSTDANADSMEDEDEDDDYRSPGDQERGLLTDVPLVLGPTEIEALPMIIQAGIVDSFGAKIGERGGKNMQAVRCHILLAQEAGRNVLRELLIFIAAWDLPDDEFYFKMMVQIMEAILKNGLMPHAYSDFAQAKDIISPAQAVVIKILTHIFRAKYSPASVIGTNNQPSTPRVPSSLVRVDVLTVRYIFTVFRGNIIPETCALIYLQGQIRAGHALAEDFPLNLWDMERVYEGVYQFLEFFAVLTESNDWKTLLVEWEIVYDLVTLIKELDASIPKAPLAANNATTPTVGRKEAGEASSGQTQPPSSVVDQPDSSLRNTSSSSSTLPPEPVASPSPPPLPLSSSESPSTFEWRNLKKLIVLVLSSLVWKSPVVQNQIRSYGGVEVILACTQYDGHNPYIREHAVMCLKFLLEGNEENQGVVEGLEAREVVVGAEGEAILRECGLEAVVDRDGGEGKGKVKIRKRQESSKSMFVDVAAIGKAMQRLAMKAPGDNNKAGETKESADHSHTSGFVEEADDADEE